MTQNNIINSEQAALLDHDETRLLGGRVVCLQPKAGYRTAIDPIFLAAAIAATPGDRVLDAGAGSGAASLCLSARVEGLQITGIEIQPDYAALARKSADLNGWSQQVNFVEGDLASLSSSDEFREFDHVMTNPPYVEAGRGRMSPRPDKALANVESHIKLDEWLSLCIRATRSRGTVTVIHRADRLEQIITAMSGKLGKIVVFPLWPSGADEGNKGTNRASRVLVCGRKGVNSPFQLSQGMEIHENHDGSYSTAANSILIDGKALALFD